MTDDQIHWFSIVNSVMIVLFLSGMVAMIMVRCCGCGWTQGTDWLTCPCLLAPVPGTGARTTASLLLCTHRQVKPIIQKRLAETPTFPVLV
jgi:hypothetical protein